VTSATNKAVPHPPAGLNIDGNRYFSNYHLAGLVLGLPVVLIRFTPFVSFGFWTYILYVLIWGLPITCAYWLFASSYGIPIDQDVVLPNRPQSDYFVINDPVLREKYAHKKVNMQVWHDAYFAGKIDIKSALGSPSRDLVLTGGCSGHARAAREPARLGHLPIYPRALEICPDANAARGRRTFEKSR
jgi:hypothetical protein